MFRHLTILDTGQLLYQKNRYGWTHFICNFNSLFSLTNFCDRLYNNDNDNNFVYLDKIAQLVFFFVCLKLSSHARFFLTPITDKGIQIMTNTRLSWPSSSEGSYACHTYCDTVHPIIVVISEEPYGTHTQMLPSVGSGTVTTCFYDLDLLRLGFERPTFCMQAKI